jgi:hypothetical protein
LGQQPGGEEGLFEKGKSWLNHNRRARGRDFSIPIARNPLKRLDPEK